MLYYWIRMFYFARVLIAVFIIKACKIGDKEKMTKKKRFIAIICMMLMLPTELFFRGNIYMILANPILVLGIGTILYGIGLKIYVKVRNKSYEEEIYCDIDTLHRDVKFEYNPSIVGYLMNQELELRELSADILNLYAKKIINIKKDERNNYIIEQGKKYEEYEKVLNSGDKYILEKILKNSSKFNFLEWKHIIKEEYEVLNLSKKKEYMSNKKFYVIVIAIVILGIIISKVVFDSIGSGIIISPLIALAYVLIYSVIFQNSDNKHLQLTEKGEEEIIKCIKLQHFMEEYTLLKDRKPEEIVIYESYIPYAVALGVNKKYYGTIFDIFGEEELKRIIEDIDVVEYYNG